VFLTLVSLERIQDYVDIEQEPKATPDDIPPAYWPASGEVVVEGLSARYSSDGPEVLHNLNFRIASGERVGVVGRTGSGKSSLTLALLRCILTEGTVYLDGMDTNKINLEVLRTNITIIPQVPELLSDTLRGNLDPFDQYDDATLNDALHAAGLFSVQDKDDEGGITLDTAISSGGGNLSIGQRQILALARAIVRRSKLLILDEGKLLWATGAPHSLKACCTATSAIDYETDNVIQSSLRNGLGSDVTLLTIAHRLQTIVRTSLLYRSYLALTCYVLRWMPTRLWFLTLERSSNSASPVSSSKLKEGSSNHLSTRVATKTRCTGWPNEHVRLFLGLL
jgi:ABC-type multidrug transport system fused ATPase/permease subunit